MGVVVYRDDVRVDFLVVVAGDVCGGIDTRTSKPVRIL